MNWICLAGMFLSGFLIGAGVSCAVSVAHKYDKCAECPASAVVHVYLTERRENGEDESS